MADAKYRRDLSYGKPPNWSKLYREHCPVRTCPASRHARIIAEEILRDPKSPVRQMLIDAGYEPDHWASSIESVIQSLWDARRWLKWEALPPTKRYRYNGHWVPDAKAIEARSGETACGLDPKDESAVPERHSPNPAHPGEQHV